MVITPQLQQTMKSRLISVILASLVLLLAINFVSATITSSVSSFSNSTNPSDDANTRTIAFNFDLTSTDVNDSSIVFSTSGFSLWGPTLSKTSDILVASGTNSYTLTITAPKYSTNPTSGSIIVAYNNGTSILSIPVSASVNSYNSLRFLSSSAVLNKSSNNASIILKNDGNQQITNIVVSVNGGAIIDSDDEPLSVSVNPSTSFSLNPQEIRVINFTYADDPEDIDLLLGSSSAVITANGGVVNTTSTLVFNQDFCDYGQVGKDVDIVSVKDDSSSNGNFNWKLLDNIELTIKARNNDNNDDQDITVEIVLYDSSNGDKLYEDDQTILVNSDDDESFYFNFTLPADTPDDAKLYVKAYFDGNEDEQCTNHWGSRTYESISVKSKKSYEIGFTEINMESPLICGASSAVDLRVHNIGDKDQKKVLVSLTNDELGIDQDILVSNVDSGNSKKITFDIEIPQNADEKVYQLAIEARHNYDSRDDSYDDVTDRVLRSFRVEGNCLTSGSSSGAMTISPTLLSEAVAGKDLIIRASIRNNVDSGTLSIIPFGYEDWASVKSVEPSTLVLSGGETRDVTIILTPKQGVSGERRFTIRASKGTTISDQEAVVFISAASSWAIIDSIKENWVIWVIILANIILILAIIIAAVKLSRKN